MLPSDVFQGVNAILTFLDQLLSSYLRGNGGRHCHELLSPLLPDRHDWHNFRYLYCSRSSCR